MFEGLRHLLGMAENGASQGIKNAEHNVTHPSQFLSQLLGHEIPKQLIPNPQTDVNGTGVDPHAGHFAPQWMNQPGFGAPDPMPQLRGNIFQKQAAPSAPTGDVQLRSGGAWNPLYAPIPTQYKQPDDGYKYFNA